jgi:Helix-turn-helix of DDE superfamily endonuclease
MKLYAKITTKNAAQFKRLIDLSQDNFNHVVKWLKFEQSEIKKHNPQKRRGLTTSKVSVEDRVLLTFYYLRHYPTFDNLACIFNISESYCQKIYTKIARMRVKILKLPSRHNLLTKGFYMLIIDVSEQRIEHPLKHQKSILFMQKT